MLSSETLHSGSKIHTRTQAWIFRLKALLLQIRRASENLFSTKIKRFEKTDGLVAASVIAESKTALWTETAEAEQFLLAGKVQNLRLAVERLNGLEIPAGATFSFWKHLGRASSLKGYVVGRELREGCIVPNVGGGLCQISNALYDAALQADFEIVERHAHSQVITGSLAERGRDATVFWNYVDLRFRSARPFRIEAKLGRDHLRVVFRGEKTSIEPLVQISRRSDRKSEKSPNSCATCGVESCFRSLKPDANSGFGRTAFLVDEFTPEFDEYLQGIRNTKDLLFIPLDGRRFRKSNYAWTTDGFSRTKQSLINTLIRSYKSRNLAAQGATRQQSLLSTAEKLAESYARRLPFDATHIVVSQNLLPFLWRSGALGGRTFDVLMTALPISEIQRKLDAAFQLHPESRSLADFRASRDLVDAEAEALLGARKLITPHTAIAAHFNERSELLHWRTPQKEVKGLGNSRKFTVVFPASTVGRKGCYELREALRGLDVKLLTLGAVIESPDFWSGFDVEKADSDWLGRADLVILPAFVEHRPRRLLSAAANGVAVIASSECGIANVAGIRIAPSGDAAGLRKAIDSEMRARADG